MCLISDVHRGRENFEKFLAYLKYVSSLTFAFCASIFPIHSKDLILPTVHFHQFQIEAWRKTSNVHFKNEHLMDIVFSALPENIIVYPSEGYYYFNFIANNSEFKGNIRFDKALIAEGSIAFMLYRNRGDGEDRNEFYTEIKESTFFSIKKVTGEYYNLFYKGRSTAVKLHNPENHLNIKIDKSEYSFGLLFDDSGEIFELIYNSTSKAIYYVWTKTEGQSEQLDESPWPSIKIGARTGFVYMKDPLDRFILVGVDKSQMQKNSHFDGPFDQLPDRTIDFTLLRKAIVKIDPKSGLNLKSGSVDYVGAEGQRYAILSYIAYHDLNQFQPMRKCGSINVITKFISCIDRTIKKAQ